LNTGAPGLAPPWTVCLVHRFAVELRPTVWASEIASSSIWMKEK
jgi:hypothetical protein